MGRPSSPLGRPYLQGSGIPHHKYSGPACWLWSGEGLQRPWSSVTVSAVMGGRREWPACTVRGTQNRNSLVHLFWVGHSAGLLCRLRTVYSHFANEDSAAQRPQEAG